MSYRVTCPICGDDQILDDGCGEDEHIAYVHIIPALEVRLREAREIIESYTAIAEGTWGDEMIPTRARAWLAANPEPGGEDETND